MRRGMASFGERGAQDSPSAHGDLATPLLRDCVRQSLRDYLERMDGHEISGFHRFVLDEVERPLLETVLENTGGNQTLAARMLGISRGTLRKKLDRFGILAD